MSADILHLALSCCGLAVVIALVAVMWGRRIVAGVAALRIPSVRALWMRSVMEWIVAVGALVLLAGGLACAGIISPEGAARGLLGGLLGLFYYAHARKRKAASSSGHDAENRRASAEVPAKRRRRPLYYLSLACLALAIMTQALVGCAGAFVTAVVASVAAYWLAPPEHRRSLAIGIGITLFVVFIWPTPYQLSHRGSIPVRVNRISGQEHWLR